jgi:hypothetical protein
VRCADAWALVPTRSSRRPIRRRRGGPRRGNGRTASRFPRARPLMAGGTSVGGTDRERAPRIPRFFHVWCPPFAICSRLGPVARGQALAAIISKTLWFPKDYLRPIFRGHRAGRHRYSRRRAIDEILSGRVLRFDRTAAETEAVSPPGSGKSAGRDSRPSKSPVSSPRAKQPSPPARPVISKTLAASWSILCTLS